MASDTVENRNYIDSALISFGESLGRSNEYDEMGKQKASQVFRLLQEHFKNSKYPLASVHIGGSFGKKTDVIEPDLDLTILINNCQPPMENVLSDLKRILQRNEQALQIRPSSYNSTDRSVSFCFTNGIPVDLLPAAKVKEGGWNDVFKKMEDKKMARAYNPSCVERQISFMRSQDSFTHTVVRLAKIWFKSLYLGESYFWGGSSVMECIAVAAAQKEINLHEKISASRAFRRVLGMVQNLKSLRLAFSKQANGEWKRVSAAKIRRSKAKPVNVNGKPPYVGKREMLQRECFIFDPANPFQDFLEGQEPNSIAQLNIFARTTCSRLDRIQNGKYRNDFIQKLFEPLPTQRQTVSVVNPVPIDYLVSSVHPYGGTICKLIIRKKHNIRNAMEEVKEKLLAVLLSTVEGNLGTVSVLDVETAVSSFIAKQWAIPGNTASCAKKHKAAHVTVQMPYEIKLSNQKVRRYAIYVSMNWG